MLLLRCDFPIIMVTRWTPSSGKVRRGAHDIGMRCGLFVRCRALAVSTNLDGCPIASFIRPFGRGYKGAGPATCAAGRVWSAPGTSS